MSEVVYCMSSLLFETCNRYNRLMYYLIWKLPELLSELWIIRFLDFVHCLELKKKTRKPSVSETVIRFCKWREAEAPSLLGPSERANLIRRVGVTFSPHLIAERDLVSKMLCFIVILMIDQVWKASDSECYTPSSELFRIYFFLNCVMVQLLYVTVSLFVLCSIPC
jgi:hypothetical protein